ncbi:MAG: hypothetical protein BWZ00_00587 [Bacteroidetes bacterium ADurb.BinA174]|nr:MAG: hypothetical protein BWZ00_00587 [Bacteroidetes bacterium ADurb.BinA174]
MKTKTLFTVILAILAMGCVSAQNSRIVKKTINVGNFTSICASSGWDVIVKQGNRQSVSIEVSEEIAERAIVELKGSTLNISTKSTNRKFSWNDLRNGRNIIQKAYVTVTDLRELQTSGGVDIIFETPIKTGDFRVTMSGGSDMENLSLSCNSFKGTFSGGCDAKVRFSSAKNITVNASGGSDIELHDINAEKCDITVSGGCDAELSGKTRQLTLNASGGSDVSADELAAQFCDASFSGAADGKINVTENLDITVSGASDVICYGNPRDVKKSVHRSSTLKVKR